ncbi:helix-turn-helix domain-containing protein [Streptococcus mitis]|uniref:HTH cro/C1-type domain-containing protein n=1 Tax=Streptococcus mitis TaxID=28037 RepID=A0A1X1JTS7_STRMT|nr:helix-turn-helix transcriptional regulator [Streptococcus mitis]ORO90477.1 hypothetical protein B7702_02140 [Streptococcus mitis]ORO90544.1 hypothetical protein B7702_02485 [Streptococcus mitis]
MKNRKFFSEQIRLWRIGKGLSLRKASKRFGISPRTFSNWEQGLIPSDRQKERLSKELGLDRDVWKFPNVKQRTYVCILESRCMIDSRY